MTILAARSDTVRIDIADAAQILVDMLGDRHRFDPYVGWQYNDDGDWVDLTPHTGGYDELLGDAESAILNTRAVQAAAPLVLAAAAPLMIGGRR